MESDYDCKFEEMKKYIPFLESMIKRLESTSSLPTNPRQAQLDKIRSLRDLLLDKKKRMKMENLLKCEQVLVNLYAKVEQRDTLPGIKKASEPLFPSDASTETQTIDLNSARNKLKTVAAKYKLHKNDPDTLPEIAPASETEEVCTPGSKEPALFQRRPNKNSLSPLRSSQSKGGAEKKSPQKNVPKRNYTRVLVSPEPTPGRWSTRENPSDKSLISRRSPHQSPKLHSPHKKEKSSKPVKSKDLNITLKVPEESLDSLNTGDILSRIIKCPDNDVDIDTLRDLKKQILGELKQTGANDDISDLILKSYKNKRNTKKHTKKKEIEEGELSDSESEAIESIYGSLVVVDKDKNNEGKPVTASSEKEQARKIQICLVINSDKEESTTNPATKLADLEKIDDRINKSIKVSSLHHKENVSIEKQDNFSSTNKSDTLLTIEVDDDEDLKKDSTECKDSDSSFIDISSSDTDSQSPKNMQVQEISNIPFKANFYNEHKETGQNTNTLAPSTDQSQLKDSVKDTSIISNSPEKQPKPLITEKITSQQSTESPDKSNCLDNIIMAANTDIPNSDKPITSSILSTEIQEKESSIHKENIHIPLLDSDPAVPAMAKKDVVSELDILQALKNEILSESIAIPGSDVETPLLHQPKITKVASAQEIMTKKRISIEKYKEKSITTPKASLFLKDPHISQSVDNSKKASLKLTRQEQQRFNIIPLALNDSSDEDEKESTNSVDDIYEDLAPKSPDHNDKISSGPSAPVIIPIDPVKPSAANSKIDVDMRTLIPLVSPNSPKPVPPPTTGIFSQSLMKKTSELCNEKQSESRITPLLDPRMRKNIISKESPNPHCSNSQRTPRHSVNFPNMTPNTRIFEMTPSRQTFDFDDTSNRKHVYAPFPLFETRDHTEKSVHSEVQGPRWEPNSEAEERNSRWDLWKDNELRDTNSSRKWDDRDQRSRSSREGGSDYHKSRCDSEIYQPGSRNDKYRHELRDDYSYSRMDCPRTPIHNFGRADCPATPTSSFGRGDASVNSFSRSECPTTPIHPFGRSDCPTTPSHPFGRLECPPTPIHPFGRTDCPLTPSHPFGRSEMPLTPNHPFGRNDVPLQSGHPFGRTEAPLTPGHPFGRSEAPMTPNNSFGRAEMGVSPMTPNHPFGRSDYQQTLGPKVVKDPRLNRSSEYDFHARKFDDDRDRGYYKGRRKSDLPYKSSSNSESYQSYRDQSVGRNDRSKFNRERTTGRESSIGRNLQRDSENDRLYTRDRGGRSNDFRRDNEKLPRSYNEVGQRRGYQRCQSVGRSGPSDESYQRSSSRGPNDDRNRKSSNENTLAVKPQSGTSFIIDTSVNTTFQEFLNGKGLQVFEYSFDSRRCRAASVGRTLTRQSSDGRNFRESSVGRTMTKNSDSSHEVTSGYKKMVNFVRARSMGRELVDKTEMSFKDIKADLKSYKINYTNKETNKNNQPVKKSNYRDPRSRKDQFDKHFEKKTGPQSGKKTIYSPRKNNRDPRMQRDQYSDGKNKNRFEDKQKHYGIVYSSDNIAKGTILGSGYGVKNYKIPKLKKPAEEQEIDSKYDIKKGKIKYSKIETKEIEVGQKNKQFPSKNSGDSQKEKAVKLDVDKKVRKNIEDEKKLKQENVKKQITRRNKLNDNLESDEETLPKLRKSKKAIIDSDSETENIVSEKKEKDVLKVTDIAIDDGDMKNSQTSNNKIKESAFNKGFGLDDLELFPENMNTEPVLDNINDLIADLDNDIDTTKGEDFSKVMSLDNMFDSINSPEGNMDGNMDDSFKDISEIIKDDKEANVIRHQENNSNCNKITTLKPSGDDNEQTDKKLDNVEELKLEKNENNDVVEEAHCLNKKPAQNIEKESASSVQDNTIENSNQVDSKITKNASATIINEDVVSTTEEDQEPLKQFDELDADRSSTPDSTLNTSLNSTNKCHEEDGLPDSTNEKNELHSDVSSTLEQTERVSKDSENISQKENSVNSMENLLSFLQDKSKIKDLLNMLGEVQSGDSEKLKKKLEKLSEIVSDDDSNNRTKDNIDEKEVDKQCNQLDENSESVVKTDIEVAVAVENNKPFESDSNLNTSNEENKLIENDENDINETKQIVTNKPNVLVKKRRKVPLKRNKKRKRKSDKEALPNKRVTRSGTANMLQKRPKKASRELKQLQESIKEMFINDDILNATGIRMCRLAKLVDEKVTNREDDCNSQTADPKPVVVLEKFSDYNNMEEKHEPKLRKKPGPKPKAKPPVIENNTVVKPKDTKTTSPKYKPGPKSKTRVHENSDPFSYDDSISEATTAQTSELENESEDDSLASSKSFGSSEVLAELKKKPKRKKPCWQSGIIKKRRKKNEAKNADSLLDDGEVTEMRPIPDMDCFTDKSYCFFKNVSEYSCRLCKYNGSEIVKHYKTDHPHTEIPLSRMDAVVAREAVEQCKDINFHALSKMTTEKYVCRFCFDEFARKANVLEEFFWHVVSMHTGEYKRLCSECVNATRCPFNLDIPPPPKDLKGQLIGYICGKCNFTQISLENLKTHVIVRHNDEQTAVYTINLAVMSKKVIQILMTRGNTKEEARVRRSLRSKSNINEITGNSDGSETTEATSCIEPLKVKSVTEGNLSKTPVHSKLTFENDDNSENANTEVKVEKDDVHIDNRSDNIQFEEPEFSRPDTQTDQPSSDILDCSHFKIFYAKAGTKEYVCCINGSDNHYRTNLLISLKKHVQIKHSEIWDGYCSVCKVIVMPQGGHTFKECLLHMLDKHMDNFPIMEKMQPDTSSQIAATPIQEDTTPHLLSRTFESTALPQKNTDLCLPTDQLTANDATAEKDEALPKIESVVSLGSSSALRVETPEAPSVYKTSTSTEKNLPKPEEPYKYEEMQAEVMSKKHLAILEAMLTEDKLVQIFKCAGRYCSFTTDSADAALLHASTHQRIGGENALLCSYCDYDCNGNAIDLVMHVFKVHGRCPYICSHCFYRAVASQLVLAHIHRIHKGIAGIIYETATVTPGGDDSTEMLPREVAVQHYVCVDAEKQCKFKTYTQGNFTEHLTKHIPPYYCYNCSLETNHPMELLNHLKIHGVKLYQCTWCVEGGDDEGDFLAHSSARHPTKQPQAYLRIITLSRKDGVSKTMALPLAKLNKSNVPTRLITPRSTVNNPAREADKALDMEKLINSMPTLASEITSDRTKTPVQVMASHITPQTTEDITAETNTDAIDHPRLVTPPPSTSVQADNDLLPLTPVLKTEPIDESSEKLLLNSTVICLDSEEEDSTELPKIQERQNVIDLSDDDLSLNPQADKLKKIDRLALFKCYNCNLTFKTSSGFKRHVVSCFPNSTYTCAHCEYTTDDIKSFIVHYDVDHTESHHARPTYACAMCDRVEKVLWAIKTHIKKKHGLVNLTVTSKPDGNYVVNGTTRGKPGPKRKLSGGPLPESPMKRVRYGSQDLQSLPQKPILDELAYCSECEFSTKVRLNLVRHIQQHADNQLVSQTAPVNPVPHLETNEKYFDRMINLASSSLEIAKTDKQSSTVTLHIPPETASRYPKYVPDRQRYTCGAKGCSYISLDEAMLKCHWETLHAGTIDFHCVHCPPYQYLDTTKPLTASRIIAHLKMHDIRLYACSSCNYYHYRKQVVEKHLVDVHKGSAQVMVVREEYTNLSPTSIPQAINAAPTMDLKPWQCGLCVFKSMLRPEVIEHCSKTHNTKMQYKCPVCPFRASSLENVTKHQANSHPGNNEHVFYYYYREGSIPDEADGKPRWLKQRQKMGNPEPEVKTEAADSAQKNAPPVPVQPILPPTTSINLDIVKEEVIDSNCEVTMEALCRMFGDICDPNGLKYKCPLCKLVTQDHKDAMQSHLYEELRYRKWACSICCYKAFHKTGLNEHMVTEHRQSRSIEPIELDADTRVERWVTEVLDRQTALIEANKSNLAKQNIQVETPPISSTSETIRKPKELTLQVNNEKETENLIQAFGKLGAPNNDNFCCPKCAYQTADEGAMKDHLEIELNKIRWRCSGCSENSQNYHEAQLHSKTCKSSRAGQVSRPVEAIRDPSIRSSWIAAVIRIQKLAMKQAPDREAELALGDNMIGSLENSLLVVRYEEQIPTPEEEMIIRRKKPTPVASAPPSPDSDDERLVMDVPTAVPDTPTKHDPANSRKCQYCPFNTKYQQQLDHHLLRHYSLKPVTCVYCDVSFYASSMDNHTLKIHPNQPKKFRKTQLPSGPPVVFDLITYKRGRKASSSIEELAKITDVKATQSKEELKKIEEPKVICLVCERPVLSSEKESHTHDDKPTYFASKGAVVVKCCVCLSLLPDINFMHEHNNHYHPNSTINYAYFKLNHSNREIFQCGHCAKRFKFYRDLKTHHNVVHSALQFKYESRPYYPGAYDFECDSENKGEGSVSSDNTIPPAAEPVKAAKRVARKSTTKLPRQTGARKSTTKLPHFYPESDSEGEYSHYGKRPAPLDQYENVTTLMPIFNTMIPLNKLSEIIKINPVVHVKDCKNDTVDK